MKKFFSTFMAFVLIIGMIPAASASELPGESSGSCGESATWTYQDGVLAISGTGEIVAEYGNAPWQDLIPSIHTIIVNEGITKLGDCCFIYLTNLANITLPSSLTSIGAQVFQGCDNLAEISIPANVESFGNPRQSSGAADTLSSSGLHAIYVDEANAQFYSIDGVLFDRKTNALLCYPCGKSGAAYTVPDGTTSIEKSALHFCQAESVLLPNSLTSIGDWAFYGAHLKSIEIPDSVTSLGEHAFENCDSLPEITLPQAIDSIKRNTFASCENLQKVTVLNPNCDISNDLYTFDTNIVIHGHLGSTAEEYAKRYGRDFVDISTGVLYSYHLGNSGFVDLLPKKTNSTNPVFNSISVIDSATGDLEGYQPNIVMERDKSNATYQEMLQFVNELTKGCSSDYEKAKQIFRWVNANMTYQYGHFGSGFTAEGVYKLWRGRVSNCEGYTQLTNFMLHLAGISNATVVSYAHCWSAALLDGRWVMIDSTNYLFDESIDRYEAILRIDFSVNDNLMCTIDDLSGVKLACFGASLSERSQETELTIPKYISYIYPTTFFWGLKSTPIIHGTANSYAEQYLKQNLPQYDQYTYEGDTFTAQVGYKWTEDDAIYLLRHVLFPDLYPYENAPDYTKDGAVTEADAVYLLRHVLFPELYPIQ